MPATATTFAWPNLTSTTAEVSNKVVIKPRQRSPWLVHARSFTDRMIKQPNWPTLRHPNSARSRVRRRPVLGSAASQESPGGGTPSAP